LAGSGLIALSTLPAILAHRAVPELRQGGHAPMRYFLAAAPLATVAGLVFGVLESVTFALLPVYGTEVGMSPSRAAFLVSITAMGNVATQIPLGLLADRMDRRLVIALSALITAIGLALMPVLVGEPTAFNALLFVTFGISGAIYIVGLTHLGARFTGGDLAGANAAFVMMYSTGLLVGPMAVGLIMEVAGASGFAWSLSALCLAFAGFAFQRLRANAG
ncbi:MAG: MFS transporter, partial [Hyphomicrobiaceae bacterium]|nr:MFS transporter [Hyphomicrobiaceae bacterium]